MIVARCIGLAALLVCVMACASPAGAASFDCARARSKLNRLICSDAELSRLDELVWNAYGERVRDLSALQYALVRERHIQWRRSRGLYESTVEALKHEYRTHQDWLTHPFLWLEGRYQRTGIGVSTAHFEVDVDTRSRQAAEVRGLVLVSPFLAWQASVRSEPKPSAPAGTGITFRVRPMLPGNDAELAADCSFEIAFSGDDALLAASASCGKAFDGHYTRVAR
jgi:uncharacterized protein YecT (DUF1311 family)